MSRLYSLLIACFACIIVSGCAATGQDGGDSILAPTPVSEIYSQASLRIMLAFMSAPYKNHFDHPELECTGPTVFEERVARIGAKLAEAAYRIYPDLSQRIPRFVFTVSDKSEAAVASTAGGLIVVLRPVSEISLSDDALAFVMARELGHVISRHHEQNTATSIAFSVAATVLAPALNVARLLALLTSSTSSAAAASTVSSAVSYASSRAVIATYGQRQRMTADGVALRLLPQAGYEARAVPAGFVADCPKAPPTKWLRDLQESVALLTPSPARTNDARIAASASTPQPAE